MIVVSAGVNLLMKRDLSRMRHPVTSTVAVSAFSGFAVEVAITPVVPGPLAITVPVESISATLVFRLLQTTVWGKPRTVAVNRFVSLTDAHGPSDRLR